MKKKKHSKVCKVLDELNAIQIFRGFIFKYNSVYPRAIEIFLGIFVNMVSLSDQISLKLVKNAELINFIVYDCFSPMLDVQVVTQCVRLFSLFLVGESGDNAGHQNDQDNVKLLFIKFLKNETDEDKENSLKITNWQGMIEKVRNKISINYSIKSILTLLLKK